MNRRQQILRGMSGGTQAPAGRRKQIRDALANPGAVRPKRFPQVGQQSPKPGTRAALVNPAQVGGQLAGRVASGAIKPAKARQVRGERQMLRKAFGSDWRSQVFGQGGAKGLRSQGGFGTAAVRTKRNQALQRAKRKLY